MHMHTDIYTYMYVSIYTYTYTRVCVYSCRPKYICIYIHICIHTYTYIYITHENRHMCSSNAQYEGELRSLMITYT